MRPQSNRLHSCSPGWTWLALLLATFAFGASPADATGAARPLNVLIIMADDLGYGDLGAQGGRTLRTPAMDGLAAAGARFTDFYVTAPRCTPTRGAFLTGRYPQRNGVTGLLWPEDSYGLAPSETTLAEVLRRRGYATALVGKWHLGHARPEFLPHAHGFEHWFGTPYPTDMDGEHPRSIKQQLNWPALRLVRNEAVVEQPIVLEELTRQFTTECVEFIQRHRDRPWFLYYATHVPHTYLAASERFRGRSRGGLYGDMVEEFDGSVKDVLAALRASGQWDHTVIIFTNDNGAVVRSPAERARQEQDPDFRRIAADGSGGSNAPLRGGKNTAYEGGVRVPTFMVVPGLTKAGTVIRQPASIMDLLPTVASLTGATLPEGVTLDGVDLTPVLRGDPSPRTSPLFFDCPRVRAVRQGRWKLVLPWPQWQEKAGQPELYDLEVDPSEASDLAGQHPDTVARLWGEIRTFEASFNQR